MLRLVLLITRCFFLILYYVPKMEYYATHRDKYGDDRCYELAIKVLARIDRYARIQLNVRGEERLPKEGGYIMYANHQGRYDALGILHGHKLRATVLIAAKRSKALILKQFIDLIDGIRIDRDDIRSQVLCIQEVVRRVSSGERVLIFPEGKYENNGNQLQEFMVGSFKVAKRAKAPIVPVMVYDSYKVFTVNSIQKCKVYIEFLSPISYEQFQDKSTSEISDMVKGLIESAIEKRNADRKGKLTA